MRRHKLVSVAAAALVALSGCSFGRHPRPSALADRLSAGTSTTTPTPTTTAAPSTTSAAPAQLSWTPCGLNECSTLQVPLDHTNPAGKTIGIALKRRKATDPAHRIGSLVFNPGGPGASGVEAVDFVAGRLSTAITQKFDVVGFDPRGVGSSSPIHCLPPAGLDAFFHADPSPDDPQERQQLIDVTKTFVDGCVSKSGELLAHVGTADVARDMDLLRASLGDDKLSFVGFSYGTELGATYDNLFPGRVRALVLDGAVDPTLSTNDSNRAQAKGFDSALVAFIADCAKKGSTCAWKPSGGVSKDAFTRLIKAIDHKPIPGSGSRIVGPSEAQLGAAAALYDQRSWGLLAAALADAEGGQGASLLALFDTIVDRKKDGTFSNLQEVYAAVSCRDHSHPSSTADVESTATVAAQESPAFGSTIVWSGLVCVLWPVPAETFPAPVGPRSPVLVIGTTDDPATPYVWAQSLSKQLGARLLTLQGEGHTAYGKKNRCIDGSTDAYLLTLSLPPEGTVC